jgi:hypothetical protein
VEHADFGASFLLFVFLIAEQIRSSRVPWLLNALGSIVIFENRERFERSNNTKFYSDGEWADP